MDPPGSARRRTPGSCHEGGPGSQRHADKPGTTQTTPREGRRDLHDQLLNELHKSKMRSVNVGLMLGNRLRRWSNNKPTLVYRLVFAGRRT